MLKRDRTSEERAFDGKVRDAMMRLGTNPAAAASPTPYPYVLAWDRLGRKGQRVRILRQTTRTAQIEFEDGLITVLNRMAVRRN